MTASATVKTGGSGAPNPWTANGTYTVEDMLCGGLAASYGLAIKDNASESIWILNWSDMADYEFSMVTGAAGGNWSISGGVDPDDQAYCEFATGNQWFMTDYSASFFAVFEEDGTFLYNVDGPAGYTNLFGVGVGHDMIYLGSPNESTLAWAPYTGTETTIPTWSEMAYESVYGLAVYGDFLFVACGLEFEENIFIHEIASDGTPSASPVWSCMFSEGLASVNGGIDYDGEFLWVYPQNDFLYKLDIDFSSALESDTWGSIKSTF